MCRTTDDRHTEAVTLDSLGYIARHSGQLTRALDYYQQALTLFRQIGSTGDEAEGLEVLGEVHHALGRHPEARRAWQHALDLYRAQHRTTEAEHTRSLLDTLGTTPEDPPQR
jgi:tetratricopeptide (TPR) repeat protein